MSTQPCLLVYDIPERAPVRNPSYRLRRLGVRVNLSCWVIREGDIPLYLMNDLQAHGAEWHCVRFDVSESEKLVRMATATLRKDISAAVARARRSADRYTNILDREPDVNPVVARERHERYRRQTSAVVSRLRRMLRDTEAVAERFGIAGSLIGTASAATQARGIQEGMKARARAYAQAADILTEIGTTDTKAMARVMQRDEGIALIAADMIEENGGDATALRTAFAGTFG